MPPVCAADPYDAEIRLARESCAFGHGRAICCR
jgi:hypothetical protein